MISCILFLWICIRLSAPVWVYVLLGIYAALNCISLGARLYKAVKE
jgi:hypothetical protein